MIEEPNQLILAAIARLTNYVRKHAHLTSWETIPGQYRPTTNESSARISAINRICDEMEALAQRSGSDDVRFPDFHVLKDKLAEHHCFLSTEHMKAVSEAFWAVGRLDRK